MIQEIYSQNNKYAAFWDKMSNNGYWIYPVQGMEDDPKYVDTDYQIGFYAWKEEQFYLYATVENYPVNLKELNELCAQCQYQSLS